MNPVLIFARDLTERCLWTFLQAFAGVFAVSNLSSFSELHVVSLAALGAGIAAVASLLKGVVAGTVTGTASTVRLPKPPSVQPQEVPVGGVTPADPGQPAAGVPPPAEPAAAPPA